MTALDKRTLRRSVRAEIAKLSDEEKVLLSARIFATIEQLEAVENATVVALYAALADEPQSAEIIDRLAKSKRVVLPRIKGDEMDFYDISEGVSEGSFGILEPIATTPIEPSEIDVMVVPGVAFTRNGARLGRGKGFYDKYLSRNGFRAYTIGVCYPCQIVESIPTEEHDKTLDRVESSE